MSLPYSQKRFVNMACHYDTRATALVNGRLLSPLVTIDRIRPVFLRETTTKYG